MNPNDLHWTESNIESVSVTGRSLAVVASGVFVLGQVGARRVKVTYTGVAQAQQETTEYVGDPKAPAGFKHPKTAQLVEPIALTDTSNFGLEGIAMFEPVSW